MKKNRATNNDRRAKRLNRELNEILQHAHKEPLLSGAKEERMNSRFEDKYRQYKKLTGKNYSR